MNSRGYERYDRYDKCDKCDKHDKCDKYDKYDKHEEKCPTIIKCGCPSSTTLPIIVATDTNRDFNLATLTLDTSCLCDPNIKLEFASNFVIPIAFTGTLSIQVFKQCKNQFNKVPVGPAWSYNAVALLSSDTFSFFVCDSDICNDDCCTYTVVARVVSAVTVGTLTINNATLGAVATCNQSCKECKKHY